MHPLWYHSGRSKELPAYSEIRRQCPPPAASKNEVLKLRSVNNIVIAPAKTGRDNNNKTAVITTAQPNSANFVPQKRINVYRIRPYLD